MLSSLHRDRSLISAWLLAGVIMVFIQILLGGITRLTGSGLSITRWEIVTGTLPPLNESQWNAAFDLYKQTPQYQKINEGMGIDQFKFIFFWEYLHRLWARIMGFVFAIPFIYFLLRKSLNKILLIRLLIVILLAVLAAVFGWIMVASGLVERPWVNAYKLTVHLAIGIALFVYLFFTWLSYKRYSHNAKNIHWRNIVKIMIGLTVIQLAFGGFVSGMKAAMSYPTWPSMHGEFIPEILLHGENWKASNFLMYDESGFMVALVQVIHRNLAYVIAVMVIVFAVKWMDSTTREWHWITWGLIGIIVVQLGLGVLTLLHSIGSIPVFYGALHQGLGIIFFTFLIYIHLVIKPVKI